MKFFIIPFVSFIISFVSLFSGFGLGTVLLPVFAIFFPLPIAIAATAVVHLVNSLFKLAIVGKLANLKIALLFGIPAAIFSAIGAFMLVKIANWTPFYKYYIGNHECKITAIGLVVGILILLVSIFELSSKLSKVSFSSKYIPLGGVISGFFGGISGNQGAFRSAFLIKSVRDKEEYIGTTVISSIFVDTIRLIVYGWSFYSEKLTAALTSGMRIPVIAACITAILGSLIAALLIEKVTYKMIQILVGAMLLLSGTAISSGLL